MTIFGSLPQPPRPSRRRGRAGRTTQQEVDKLITNLPSLISRGIYQESSPSTRPRPEVRSGPLTLHCRALSTQTPLANEVRSKTGLANNVREARNERSRQLFRKLDFRDHLLVEVYAAHVHHCLCGTSGSSVLLQLQSSVSSFSSTH